MSRDGRKRKRTVEPSSGTAKRPRRKGPSERGPGPRPSSSAQQLQRGDSPGPSTSASLEALVGQEVTGGSPQPTGSSSPQPPSSDSQEAPVRQEATGGPRTPPAPRVQPARSSSPEPSASGSLEAPEEVFWAPADHPHVPAGWRLSPMTALWSHYGDSVLVLQVVLPGGLSPHQPDLEVLLYLCGPEFRLVTPPWVPPSTIHEVRESMTACFQSSAYSCEM